MWQYSVLDRGTHIEDGRADCQSVGGGRGNLCGLDGDVPLASLRRVKCGNRLPTDSVELIASCTNSPVLHGNGLPRSTSDYNYASGSCKFMAITWNACGLEIGAVSDLVWQLSDVSWDAVLVQEGPFSELDSYSIVWGGHALFLAACDGSKRSVGILLHSKWVSGRPS